MRPLSNSYKACIIGGLIGGALTLLDFMIEVEKHSKTLSDLLNFALLPGAIAYILVSGGEAGSTRFAEAVAPFMAVFVNMAVYSLFVFGISRIITRRHNLRAKQQ